MNNLNLNTTKWVTILLGMVILAYIAMRAYLLSMTHDESLSFSIIDGDNYWKYTANNHLLNTQLMTYCSGLFGNSALSLRLPNVLSFLVYYVFCYLTLSKIKSNAIQMAGFALLLLNPFLLDFFSLARGYGISLSLQMASIYYLQKQLQIPVKNPMSLHNYLLFNLFGAAAMYANLSTINYFLAAHLLLIVRNRLPIPILIMLVSGSIPVYLGIKQLILLKSFKQLYFGEDNLFSSFNSVIDSSLYGQNYIENIGPIIHILLISISLFGLVTILIKKDYNNHWLNLLALNLFILLAMLLENWLFGAMFPKERTGLFLLLLWALSIIFLWDYLHHIFPSSQKLEWPMSIFLSLILVLHFYKSVNLQYCHTWKYDAHTKEILKIIEEKTHNDSTSLSNYYLFEPSLKYYIKTNQLKIRLTGTHEIKDNVNYVYRYQDTSYLTNYRLITQFYPIESNLMELVPN